MKRECHDDRNQYRKPALHPALTPQSLRSGLKPEAVIAEVYRRIRVANDPGIFIHLPDEAETVSKATALGAYDPAKPLWVTPCVKDNIDVAGMPTTSPCPLCL